MCTVPLRCFASKHTLLCGFQPFDVQDCILELLCYYHRVAMVTAVNFLQFSEIPGNRKLKYVRSMLAVTCIRAGRSGSSKILYFLYTYGPESNDDVVLHSTVTSIELHLQQNSYDMPQEHIRSLTCIYKSHNTQQRKYMYDHSTCTYTIY